ncbi:NUDIX hydrolase [Actinoalloteichus hymeniacidonis]|uniref:NUDIX hydrolase n=1 Tax=Actinoalloteichus hymeniacidonis TaxID=340345 RepID=UPI00184F5E99|nr:NUDIX domain-containing protein [Actinoalloteichus hymeniacidonis]MBB5909645.1 ADP-ribose pyrophosphatase YjhB (NUDIX family) [Actinoalloteichus hymeniacidonis]
MRVDAVESASAVGTREIRIGSYAVCREEDRILLARFVGRSGTMRWTLPGGGLDHAEDPLDAVVREVEEETGFRTEVDALLGVNSQRRHVQRDGLPVDHHALQIFYAVHIVGGSLRHEIGGSTDQARWFDVAEVDSLECFELVALGLELDRLRPAGGRVLGQPAVAGSGDL